MYNPQICVRSLKNTQNGPTMPPVQHFVRAEMLPSGYLIRPCEGGGSIIHIVDHMDLEVSKLFIKYNGMIFFIYSSSDISIKRIIALTRVSSTSLVAYLKSCAHCMNHPLFLLKR